MSTLTRRERRVVALGALVIGPVLLWRAVVAPVMASTANSAERADAAAELLAREQALQRDGPRLPAALANARRLLAAEAPRLFAASDTTGATASLSAWVRSTADAAGMVGIRVESAPVIPAPAGLIAMQVDVRAQAEIAELTGWLARLERGERLLRVERLDITADGDGLLAISARVRGYAHGRAP